MGGVLLGGVTPGASVVCLMSPFQQAGADPTLFGAVFGQPPAFAEGFSSYGLVHRIPVNVVVHQVWWDVVFFDPPFFCLLPMDLLVKFLLADAGLFGSLEGDPQSFPTQGSIRHGVILHCLVKTSFGSGVHGHIEGFPP